MPPALTAALRVWRDRHPLVTTTSWPLAAHHAATWIRLGATVHLEWVPCAVSPLGQVIPLVSAESPSPTSAHRAWVLLELDASGAVVARPECGSSGVT